MNWWTSLRNALAAFGTLLIAGQAIAQDPINEWRKKYAGYHELILNETRSYNFSVADDGIRVTQDNFFESLILTNAGIRNNTESFSYSELVPLLDFEAYTLVPNRRKSARIPVSQTTDKLAQQQHIFHNDVMVRKLTYSNLEAGARKVYRYQREFLDPYLLHNHIFASNFPIRKSALEVVTDKDVEIGFVTFNDPDNRIVFEKQEKRKKNHYTWTLHDPKPIKYEPNNPGFLHIAPHIVVYIKEYESDNGSQSVLGSIDRLYRYYQGFVKDLNQKENESLKRTTLSITEGLTSDEEKLKAIYYWVKDNIRYIAFEHGYEGFIPREAGLVYERKFGDCKDMSNIITEMARYAGIDNVNLCWIGTREIPYGYSELATPAVDDHMIASYEKNGEIIFLDATSRETPYGLPTGFIQGKEALMAKGNHYKIVTVPVIPAAENRIAETLDLLLNGNILSGSGRVAIHGLARSDIISALGDASGKNRFDLVKNLVVKGSNKFNLKKYTEKNTDDRDKPYLIDYGFELDSYVLEAGDNLYVNLFLDKPLEDSIIEAGRASKYEFGYLPAVSYDYRLDLPEGLSPGDLPKDVSFDNDLLSYTIRYVAEDGAISLNFDLELKKLLMDPADFENWNSAVNELKAHYKNSIILNKK